MNFLFTEINNEFKNKIGRFNELYWVKSFNKFQSHRLDSGGMLIQIIILENKKRRTQNSIIFFNNKKFKLINF